MNILHVADTHLGFRQYGLEARRVDMARAFEQVVDVAINENVSAVIHAGDVFDTRTPSTDDLRDVVVQLDRLREAAIPFLGIVGNHEGKRGHQWIDLLEQLNLAVHLLADAPFDLHGTPVYGVDYISRRADEVAPPRCEGGILVMHQLLDQTAPHGELALKDLFECGAKLILLGDDHQHNVWRGNDTMITFSGSTERCSSSEVARRGFSTINTTTMALERHELNTRHFCYLGSRARPLRDPLSEIDANAAQLENSVAVLHVSEQPLTPRKLKEAGERHGALHVIVRKVSAQDADSELGASIQQLNSGRHLERAIEQALAEKQFSPLTHQVDELVRDTEVPDSRVDERITEALKEARL